MKTRIILFILCLITMNVMGQGTISSSSQRDPVGPSSGSNRVDRGGSWYDDARFCRSSYRFIISPDYRFNYLGFRLVLSEL